jgi:hypothetical protein
MKQSRCINLKKDKLTEEKNEREKKKIKEKIQPRKRTGRSK